MGLIEVLIAVLILSIGLLGIALVQTRSLSGNNSSMARTMAVVASYSILEAMRADRTNALAGNYNTPTAGLKGNACPTTNSTLAESQLASWCNELAARLGAVATTIGQISCASSVCTITITFDDSRGIGQASGDASATADVANSAQVVVTKAPL